MFYLRSWLILFIVISQPSFDHRLTLAIYFDRFSWVNQYKRNRELGFIHSPKFLHTSHVSNITIKTSYYYIRSKSLTTLYSIQQTPLGVFSALFYDSSNNPHSFLSSPVSINISRHTVCGTTWAGSFTARPYSSCNNIQLPAPLLCLLGAGKLVRLYLTGKIYFRQTIFQVEINNFNMLSNTNRTVLHTPGIWINALGKFVPSDRQTYFEKFGYQTENSYALWSFDFSITTCVLREELLWKLIVMLGPDDYWTLANPGNPSAITPLCQLTSLHPGQLQGT